MKRIAMSMSQVQCIFFWSLFEFNLVDKSIFFVVTCQVAPFLNFFLYCYIQYASTQSLIRDLDSQKSFLCNLEKQRKALLHAVMPLSCLKITFYFHFIITFNRHQQTPYFNCIYTIILFSCLCDPVQYNHESELFRFSVLITIIS